MSKYWDKVEKKLDKRYNNIESAEIWECWYHLTKFFIPRLEKYIKNAFKIITNQGNEKADLERMLELAKLIVKEKWYDMNWEEVQYLVKLKKNRTYKFSDIATDNDCIECRCKREYLDLLHKYYFYLWY